MYILKDFCNLVLKIYRRLFARTEFVTPDILPFDRISVDQCIWKQGENSTKNVGKTDQNKMPQWYTSLKTLSLFKGSIQYIVTKARSKMPKIDTLDALEEHEEHEDDYQTNSN